MGFEINLHQMSIIEVEYILKQEWVKFKEKKTGKTIIILFCFSSLLSHNTYVY